VVDWGKSLLAWRVNRDYVTIACDQELAGLNMGEAHHTLARVVFMHRLGEIRDRGLLTFQSEWKLRLPFIVIFIILLLITKCDRYLI
jgi:TnpA family transposase